MCVFMLRCFVHVVVLCCAVVSCGVVRLGMRKTELNARVSDDARWDFKELKKQLPHCKKETSLPSRNAPCRTLDNASPCLP